MSKLFQKHSVRMERNLDGIWDFAFLGAVDPGQVDAGSIDFHEKMAVPGCFDATPAYAGKRGLAAYHTRFFLPDAARYRLVFSSVNHWCSIWINGAKLAEHSGGYSRFTMDFVSAGPGRVEMVVLVDNRFDPQRSPLHYEYFDWYQYGGITRPVQLQRLGDTWIEAMRVATLDFAERRLLVGLDYGTLRYPEWSELTLTFNGQTVLSEKVHLKEASGNFQRELAFPEAALWSPEAPVLHELYARLGQDDLRERIGIRQVQAIGQEIQINGQPVRLLGFNRHESHPEFGSALPDQIIVSDVQQLRDLGSNFVRASHYPQDERFLDLCDEAGLCVWNEITGWQHHAEHLTDPRFMAAQKLQAAEMVAMSFNHPSVLFYGFLNESASNDPTCRPAYESIIQVLRQLDPTRLITYASNHPTDDKCLDLVDVVSINTYPGWYEGSLEDIPARMDEIFAGLDAAGLRDKPVILSEIGAEGIYGWRDWNQTRWSEQYQSRLLETVVRHLFPTETSEKEIGRAAGLSIWVFNDFRTSEGLPRILGRGRGFNNKGVVDEYRRPKQAYDTVRALFQEIGQNSQ